MGQAATATPYVLVVDDNEVNLKLATVQLEVLGWASAATPDPADAIALALGATPPALILLDHNLGGESGLETARRIRDEEKRLGRPALPIVGMTASDQAETRADGARAGMNDHLPKPVDIESLRSVLRRWIEAPSSVPSAASATLDPELDAIRAMYLEQLDQRLEAINRAVEEGNPRDLVDAAHTLRGVSDLVGAPEIGRLCRELEARGREGSIEGARRLMHSLRSAASAFRSMSGDDG